MEDKQFCGNLAADVLKKPTNQYHPWFMDNLFLLCTLSGVIIGVCTGFMLRPLELSADSLLLISYPGELYMRLLKLMILPFVIACIIVGTATLDIRKNQRIAVRTISYFLSTSMLNVVIGMVLALTIQPGNADYAGANVEVSSTIPARPNASNLLDGFLDMGRNLVPDNLFQAAFEQTFTDYTLAYHSDRTSGGKTSRFNTSSMQATSSETMKRQLQFRSGTNMLGIILFCVLFGSVLSTLGPEKRVVIDFFNIVYKVLLKMLMGAIWLTPVGVCSVICGKVISVTNLTSTVAQLGWFVATMAIGVLTYQLLLLQLIYYVVLRRNPYRYYWALMPSVITAFATATKAAALPITFRLMDGKLRADQRITRFILPIGTLNMDGTALFLAVAVIFIAQMNTIPIGLGQMVTIGLTCTAASVSSAAVPSAALVLVLMLCSTIGAPTEDVALLFAVDWLVDRMRTTNNLLGDCYACAIVECLSKEELATADREFGFLCRSELQENSTRIALKEQKSYVDGRDKNGLTAGI